VPRPTADLPEVAIDPTAEIADALRRWRAARARAAGVAPHAVMSDPVLERLAQARPADLTALRALPGTGALVLSGRAEEVVAIVARVTLPR